MKKFVDFEEAREFVRSLGLSNTKEWRGYCNSGHRPRYISSAPDVIYKGKGWKGMGDWLGTGNVASVNKEFLPFEEAREFVRSLVLKCLKEYKELWKSGQIPHSLPSSPDRTYKGKGWKGWGDFLGTGWIPNRYRKYMPFEEAKEYVRGLGFKGQKEWIEYSKSGQRPPDIPSAPHATYKGKGWRGYGDWLGNRTGREFLPFEEAREYAKSLGLKGSKEWKEYSKSGQRPHDIPSAPNGVYEGKGWKGWGDWLGTGTGREFLPFEEAREFARSLILKNLSEWKEYSKSGHRPRYISSAPDVIYKDKGWKGWGDWLGTGNVASVNKDFLPFEEAREFVRSLGIENWEGWREYSKSGQKPHNIPSAPDRTYKGKGWMGWSDFFRNIKESYTLTKEEVKVVKDMNKVDSTLPKIKSVFNRLGFSKEK